jgi:hypothetical protein
MRPLRSVIRLVLGEKLDPFDPNTRHSIALIAIAAWIGLGADGLSSACYGPEEAFLALGGHTDLALFLAGATALTVFVIAASYNQVIDLFPSGGGGYKAATKLVGERAGLLSGSALIVDYVLTIAISAASGADALFSLLPGPWQEHKLGVALLAVTLLLTLNLRGMKESIRWLAPVFLGFVVTHVVLITYGVYRHRDGIELQWTDSLSEVQTMAQDGGWFFVIALFLRAYSMGGGTYTGIEAVSNNVNILAEPRVRTGHWTMFYMAFSLAAMAGGIILLYLLWDVAPVAGQTLNAVTFQAVIRDLIPSSDLAHASLVLVLLLEAGLLMIAANAGFLGGPAVLASMAADRWVPRQFRELSNRMVTQNGVLLMGLGAMLILLITRGRVSLLVVLYSINVFITFTLTLFGLCRHWWQQRRFTRGWLRPLLLSLVGLTVCAFMLIVLLIEKFLIGGWVTLLLTGAVAAGCMMVRRHYDLVARIMELVDQSYAVRMDWPEDVRGPAPDPRAPTAVLLIGASRGAGMRTLEWIRETFPDRFQNFVFVAVGEVDRGNFDTERTLRSLQARLQNSLTYFQGFCASRGLASETYEAYGADPFDELMRLLPRVFERYPNHMVFASQLAFGSDNLLTQLLHNQLPLAVQRRLHAEGHQMIIVPLQVPNTAKADARPMAIR